MFPSALIGFLRLVASRKLAENFEPRSIKSVLVVELSRLGDVLVMLPSLVQLERFFSNSHILVLVDQNYVSLLNAFGLRCEFVGVANSDRSLGMARALHLARSKSVDLAVSMSPPRRNAIIALASGAMHKLGYLSHVDSLTPFLESTPVEAFGIELPVRVSYSSENIYERPGKICSALGIDQGKTMPGIQMFARCLKEQGFPDVRKFVMMHPFTGWEYRNWPLANFLALAKRIAQELGYNVLLTCEEKDAGTIDNSLEDNRRIQIVTPSDLLEVALLMKESSLVVSNDSGPLHLAAAMGIPVVGLFGPAPPELTAPQFARGSYCYNRVECSPCNQRKCVRPDSSCMTLLSVEDVFGSVSKILESHVVEDPSHANA